jgi:transposase
MTEISSDTHSTKLFPKGRLANDSLSDVPPIFSFNEEEDYAEIQEEEPEREANEIVTGPLSDEAQLKMEVIESLLVSCDRKTYGQKLREAADKLGKSVRSVQRLVNKYEEEGISAITNTERSDKGSYRISSDWQQFIINTYKQGNKGSRKMTPAQVAIRVEGRARELGLETYPSHMSVYRVLNPLIEQKEKKQKVRNVRMARFASLSSNSRRTDFGAKIQQPYLAVRPHQTRYYAGRSVWRTSRSSLAGKSVTGLTQLSHAIATL